VLAVTESAVAVSLTVYVADTGWAVIVGVAGVAGFTVIVAVWLDTGSEATPSKLFITTQWYKKVPTVAVGGVNVLDVAPSISESFLNH